MSAKQGKFVPRHLCSQGPTSSDCVCEECRSSQVSQRASPHVGSIAVLGTWVLLHVSIGMCNSQKISPLILWFPLGLWPVDSNQSIIVATRDRTRT